MFRSPPVQDRHGSSEERAEAGGGLLLARGLLLLLRFLGLLLRGLRRLRGRAAAEFLPGLVVDGPRGPGCERDRLGLRPRKEDLDALLRGEPGLERDREGAAERRRQERLDRLLARVSREDGEVHRLASREREVRADPRLVHREHVPPEHGPALVRAPEVEADGERVDLEAGEGLRPGPPGLFPPPPPGRVLPYHYLSPLASPAGA